MTYSYQRVSIRENTSTEFWNFTSEQLAKIKSTYDDTGKRISFTVTLSDDDDGGLHQTWTHVWNSVDDWKEYNTEFAACWPERDQYNITHNIISVRL